MANQQMANGKWHLRLCRLLEDIVDLRDAATAEAEYAAGQGRPFSEYDAGRKTSGSVQG